MEVMDVVEAIKVRKSIRMYKPDPVPKKVIEEILDIATRAPSSMNSQPWEFTVIAGDVLDKIKKANVEMLNSGATTSPDASSKPFAGDYRQRQVDLAIELFRLMGIGREDKEKRAEWTRRGFRFFDAPAVIIISMDRSLDEGRPQFDIGAISQTIALAALKYGLGTCIQGQGIMFPQVVRKYAGIPDSKRMIICITIGYPDATFPANKIETKRVPADKITTWCGI
jgi:nitroreductase